MVQIIHTNDLHSHLEHATDPRRGGYAAIKATVQQLKQQAYEEGIESLILDAGDFLEGSQFYLAGQGREAFKAMNAIGYDAVTIGNHDWLMGSRDLDRLLADVPPQFNFLGANFHVSKKWRNTRTFLKSHAIFERAGMRIAVLGLTTDSMFYSWRVEKGTILNPLKTAKNLVPKLRREADFVIALTHIGHKRDKRLAANLIGLDLIVGGHSHDLLLQPALVKSQNGRDIAIVQAGKHGEFVGRLLVDLEPGKKLKIVRYDVVPVFTATAQDPEMLKLIFEAREELEREYGRDWLYEVVGYTDVPLEVPKDHPTTWGNLVADTLRETAQSDIALDVSEFSGLNQPAGPITREQLFLLYPRIFDWKDRFGWSVWTSRILGTWLRLALKIGLKVGHGFTVSGVTFEVKEYGGRRLIGNLKVNGEPLLPHRYYTVAFPEGIVRGALEISKTLGVLFRNPKNTEVPIWFALERKMRELGRIQPSPLVAP